MTKHDQGLAIRFDAHLPLKFGGGRIVAFSSHCSYDICNRGAWATRAREV